MARNEEYHTKISYRPAEGTLKLDRKFSGSRRAVIHQRRAKVAPKDGVLKLRVILDRYSVEVFINDGMYVMTAVIPTDLSAAEISFRTEGKAVIDVTKREIRL